MLEIILIILGLCILVLILPFMIQIIGFLLVIVVLGIPAFIINCCKKAAQGVKSKPRHR